MKQCPVCNKILDIYEYNITTRGIVCDSCFPLMEYFDDSDSLEEIRKNLKQLPPPLYTPSKDKILLPFIKKCFHESVLYINNLRFRRLNTMIENHFLYTIADNTFYAVFTPELKEIIKSSITDVYYELFLINRETCYLFSGIRFKLTVEYFTKRELINHTITSVETFEKVNYRNICSYIEKNVDESFRYFAEKLKEESFLFYLQNSRDENREYICNIVRMLLCENEKSNIHKDELSDEGAVNNFD